MADLENLLWVVKEQFAHTLLTLLSLFCWWESRQVCDKICPDFSEVSHIHKSQDWAVGVVVPYVSLKTFVSWWGCRNQFWIPASVEKCRKPEPQELKNVAKGKHLLLQSESTSAPSASNSETTIIERDQRETWLILLFQLFSLWSKATWYHENPLTNYIWLSEVTASNVSTGRKKHVPVLPLALISPAHRGAKGKGHRFRRYDPA